VLVVAAEEFDWILAEAHRAWRLVPSRDAGPTDQWNRRGAPLAEGAAAVLLSRDPGAATVSFAEGRTHFSKADAAVMLDEAVADLACGAPPDRIVSGANGTWAEAGIERVLAGHFPGQRPESLKPGHATRECLGAGALLLVVLALEELQCIGKQRALVASLGWNQQAAAVWIERTPG